MQFSFFFQAGDKSLADVVAHEIAHSWTGNLVTNQNFEHFWLNEGFTVFVENKIVGRLHGDLAKDFHSILGLNDLRDCVSNQEQKTHRNDFNFYLFSKSLKHNW